MSSSTKRSNSKDPSGTTKRVKTEATTPEIKDVALLPVEEPVPAKEPKISKPRRTKKQPSPAPEVRETITLPPQEIKSTSIQEILDILNPLVSNDPNDKHPLIIGSRAASFWVPSFRPFEDWDIIATPSQAHKMIQDMQAYGDCVSISLIRQPLDKNVVKRRPMTPEINDKLDVLPSFLYKVCGEIKNALKFEIEILPFNEQDGTLLTTSSTAMLLEMCNNEDQVVLNFPIGPNKGHSCVVASIEVLEALKTSHINWPAYFSKHIADLHTLRALLPTTASTNMGIRADKKKPLTSPERTPELESCLLTRTLEVEAFRGTPGAHINLNVSNEDFLGRDDDLFVTRHIPHDDVHELVKYGDAPIYDQLKTDSSKAMVSKELFGQAPYETQLKCVKEEAMVIALERFLLPGLASDPSAAYKSALIRICTNLTKGWFRQFAIDNFPRLAVCDKDLLSIRDEILEKYPLPPETKADPLELLKVTVPNLEELVVVQKLMPLTEAIDIKEVRKLIAKDKRKRRALIKKEGGQQEAEEEVEKEPKEKASGSSGGGRGRGRGYGGYGGYGGYRYGRYDHSYNDHYQNFWIIHSSSKTGHPILICFDKTVDFGDDECSPSYSWSSTLSIQLLNADTDLKQLQDTSIHGYPKNVEANNSHTVGTYVYSSVSGGSWGGEDIWGSVIVKSRAIEDQVVQSLGLEGLNEDLLMKYIVAVVQPKHGASGKGDTPFVNDVNRDKSNGLIPQKPKNHLWYDLWKYKGRK